MELNRENPGATLVWFGQTHRGQRFDATPLHWRIWCLDRANSGYHWYTQLMELEIMHARYQREQGIGPGEELIWFGKKHTGQTIASVYAEDEEYLDWCLDDEQAHHAWHSKLKQLVTEYRHEVSHAEDEYEDDGCDEKTEMPLSSSRSSLIESQQDHESICSPQNERKEAYSSNSDHTHADLCDDGSASDGYEAGTDGDSDHVKEEPHSAAHSFLEAFSSIHNICHAHQHSDYAAELQLYTPPPTEEGERDRVVSSNSDRSRSVYVPSIHEPTPPACLKRKREESESEESTPSQKRQRQEMVLPKAELNQVRRKVGYWLIDMAFDG